MNGTGYSMIKNDAFDEFLIKELFEYGIPSGDYSVEDTIGYHRIRVITHDKTNKVYWIRQYNGKVIEFREVFQRGDHND